MTLFEQTLDNLKHRGLWWLCRSLKNGDWSEFEERVKTLDERLCRLERLSLADSFGFPCTRKEVSEKLARVRKQQKR